MPRSLRRSAIVFATALLAVGTVLSAPALAGTGSDADLAPQPFAADSGDTCRYGTTEGTLEWPPVSAPPGLGSVNVTGTIADRPLERDPGPICVDDGLYSVVTFYAYGRGTLIAQAAEKVDNDISKFTLRLAPREPSTGVDTLVVQVCRASSTSSRPIGYCGVPRVYSSSWS